jgi:hypothetical protein
MVQMKKIIANGHPNRPAENTSSEGLVRGDATMNATSGAHGVAVANIPNRTAVVPHEQNGVRVASSTAPTVATTARRLRSFETRSVPT